MNFAYGRRGSTLNTGSKTPSPVPYEDAKRIFNKLVQEKTAKGYTPGPDGTPYVGGNADKQPSGYLPQLLNAVDLDYVERLVQDDRFCAQEKFDGRRLLLRKAGAAIDAINRKGLVIGMPETVFQSFAKISGDCVIDGECIGDTFRAFDILMSEGNDVRPLPYRSRLATLMNVLGSLQQPVIQFAPTAFTRREKSRLLASLRASRSEGIVFKQLDAPYTPGRPNSGGSQFKCKFIATLSALVTKINAQRSVEIRLLSEGGWLPAGNVTIPPDHPLPITGKVIEVRYLYAMPGSGILYQPVYLGERSDVQLHECVRSQLKFKRAESGE